MVELVERLSRQQFIKRAEQMFLRANPDGHIVRWEFVGKPCKGRGETDNTYRHARFIGWAPGHKTQRMFVKYCYGKDLYMEVRP